MENICENCVKRDVCIYYIEYRQLLSTIWNFPKSRGLSMKEPGNLPPITHCPGHFPEPEEGGDERTD